MNTLIVTEVRIYVYENNYYASESFSKILERYNDAFKKITLLTRLIKSDKIPNGYKNITNLCINFQNSESIIKSAIPYNEKFRILVQESDFIILRVPSMISSTIYRYIKKYNKKYMTEAMGCAWDAYWNHGIMGKIVAVYGYLNMKRVVKNANYATYVTQYFLQKRYPCKNNSIGVSNVNITKVNSIKDYSKFDKKNISMMTAAAVDVKYKGQAYVIKAMKKLKNKGINVKYYLAGGGNQKYLRKIAKKYGVEDNVVFMGQLNHDELFNLINKTDIYIQPSLQEGLPRSVIEAMSFGCVCLGSNTAGIPELLSTKCLFKRANPISIVNTIVNIINDNMHSIGTENINKAKMYLSCNLEKKRFEFYKNIIIELEKDIR